MGIFIPQHTTKKRNGSRQTACPKERRFPSRRPTHHAKRHFPLPFFILVLISPFEGPVPSALRVILPYTTEKKSGPDETIRIRNVERTHEAVLLISRAALWSARASPRRFVHA